MSIVSTTTALMLPPALPVGLIAVCTLFIPRRVGYVLSIGTLTVVVGWTLLVPAGTGLTAGFVGVELVFVSVDEISRLVGFVLAGFGIAAVGYGAVLEIRRFHLAIALTYIASALVAVFAGDWLTLVIGWELLAITGTVLIWHDGGNGIRPGYRYALIHALGGALFIVGVALHASAVGPELGAETLHYDGSGVTAGLPAIIVGSAIAINAGAIGVHLWLPRAYAVPHVASSVILSAYTTKVAVYAAARAFPDGNIVLAMGGGAMAVYGAAYALVQKEMRTLLAYHIQAQVGYMLAGIGIGSALGIAGGFAHLLNNVLYKGLLFMLAGIIIVRTGHERLDRVGALGYSVPVVLVTFIVAAAAISGLPGTNGFVSKGMVLDAALEADAPLLRALLLVGTVGTVASFCKFGYYAFLKGSPRTLRDASRGHSLIVVAIAGLCLGIGLVYDLLFNLLPATGQWSTDPYSSRHLTEKAVLIGAGGAVFWLLKPLFARVDGGIDIDRLRDPAVFYGCQKLVAGIETVARVTDQVLSTLAWKTVTAVRNPADWIRRRFGPRWRARYDQRVNRLPGEAGFRLSIGTSIVIAVATTVLALVIALL